MAARSFILSMSSTGCWGQSRSREQKGRRRDTARNQQGRDSWALGHGIASQRRGESSSGTVLGK